MAKAMSWDKVTSSIAEIKLEVLAINKLHQPKVSEASEQASERVSERVSDKKFHYIQVLALIPAQSVGPSKLISL